MARNRWLRVRPRLLLVAVVDAVAAVDVVAAAVDAEFFVAAVDVDSCGDETDADADATLCRLRTLPLLLPVAVVTVLAVAILPRLPCVVRLLAEDGLPPFVLPFRCGDDAVDVVDFDVDVDGKDKDGDADSAAEAYVALFRQLCLGDAADAAEELRD